jgi:hypothetical protein
MNYDLHNLYVIELLNTQASKRSTFRLGGKKLNEDASLHLNH